MSTGIITLITGTPGAGKSLFAVHELLKPRDRAPRLFSVGIEWLQDKGVTSLPDLTQWCDPAIVPDGSVIVVDEADVEGRFPQRAAGMAVPAYIGELKRVRHRGIELIIVTQHPKQIDVAVRRLVGRHVHLERLFGAKAAQVFGWNKCVERVDDRGARFGAVKSQWFYPPDLFTVYKSASLHTIERKIPWRIAIIPVLLLVLCGLAWGAWSALNSLVETDEVPMLDSATSAAVDAVAQVTGGKVSKPSNDSSSNKSAPRYADAAAYAEAHVPRVPSNPWSAPIFDAREAVAQPELYCVSSETGRCLCHTEQGTRYYIEPRTCFQIVHHGLYNPYRAPRIVQQAIAEGRSVDRPASREDLPGIRPRDVPRSPPQSFPSLNR